VNALSLQALYPADYHAEVEPQRMGQFDPSLRAEMARRSPDWRVARGYPGGMGVCCAPGRGFSTRFGQLSPDTQKEVVKRAIEWGVERGFNEWRSNALRGIGLGQQDLENAIARGVHGTLGQLIPNLTSGLVDQVTASAKQATSDIIEEKLQKWGFPLAAVVGVVAAVLSVIGMLLVGGYLAKKLG
jgi:hypothetical protein